MRTILLVGTAFLAAASAAGAEDNWPEFRGPGGRGDAGEARPPLRWSETENVKWKVAIHDRGWSSPVVWGGQVWLTTAGRHPQSSSVTRKMKHNAKVSIPSARKKEVRLRASVPVLTCVTKTINTIAQSFSILISLNIYIRPNSTLTTQEPHRARYYCCCARTLTSSHGSKGVGLCVSD